MPKVVSVVEMVAVEKAADAGGLTYAAMMENAGLELAESIVAHSHSAKKSVFALIGKGNNGGDALVACAHLAQKGWKVSVWILSARENDEYLERVQKAGGKVTISQPGGEFTKLEKAVEKHAVFLDGLLGTGLTLPLRTDMANVLQQVKTALSKCKKPLIKIAIDCPSGMDCDSGEIADETIHADLTVCMAAVKQGMLTAKARKVLGEIDVVGIGLPEELAEWAAIKRFVVDQDWVKSVVPRRPADSHKGTYGNALIIAGSKQFSGAALLAGKAAARSGAGLISMAVPESVREAIIGKLPEAIWISLAHSQDWISVQDSKLIQEKAAKADVVLIGPGFGLEKDSAAFMEEYLQTKKSPRLVIDADALKLLLGLEYWHKKLPQESVLTPHPGEMSILTGLSKEDIQSERLEIAEGFALEWSQIVLLKGAFTIVAAPDGRTAFIPISTSALATAGTGDVLAGLITGLLAQGLAPFEAACVGAWLHATAGLNAAIRIGSEAGVIASDLLVEFPKLLKH